MFTDESGALLPEVQRSLQLRYRLAVVTWSVAVVLASWSGFAFILHAGLSVPIWAWTVGLWPPAVPWVPGNWMTTGCAGLLVGLTLGLGLWSYRADPRPGVRGVAMVLLIVLMLQLILLGLRWIEPGLDFTLIHAGIDPLGLALLVALVVFASPEWIDAEQDEQEAGPPVDRPGSWGLAAVGVFYIVIGLGAVIRNQGAFISSGLLTAYGICLVLAVGLSAGLAFYMHGSRQARPVWKVGGRWLGIWIVVGIAGTIPVVMYDIAQLGVLAVGFSQLLMELLVVLLWSTLVMCTLWVKRRPITDDQPAPGATYQPDPSGS